MKSENILRNCPICNTSNESGKPNKYSKAPWVLKSCKKCNFVYLENAPKYEALEEEFAWEKTSLQENATRQTNRPIQKNVSDFIKKLRNKYIRRDKLIDIIKKFDIKGNVLDVGCGGGTLFHRFPSGITPFGIEISKQLAHTANEFMKVKNGYTVQNNAIDGTQEFPDEFFNAVVLSAFLEHEVNPKELLTNVYRILKNDSLVIIKVPNFASWLRIFRQKNWSGFRYPDHVNYFTPKSISKLVKDCGYDIAQFCFFDRFPLNDNLWIVIRKP